MRYNNFVIHFNSPKVTFLFCFFKSNRLIRITVPSTVLLYLIQIIFKKPFEKRFLKGLDKVDAVKLLHETDGILIDLGRSKYDGILHEINARMILYNFCELVTSHAVVKTSKNTKHVYKINFATIILRYEADMQSVFLSYTKNDLNSSYTCFLRISAPKKYSIS